jgi:VCBS repeat-containing protein
MGTLFRPVVFVGILFCALPSPARAAVTLSGSIPFSTLDNGSLDEDPALGVFAVSDSLRIEGTIDCTDAPPLPGGASGCSVHLVTGGDLVIAAGGAIVTENQRGAGNGGAVTLEATGDVVLHGPTPSLPGARVSSARITTANPGGGQHGGAIHVEAGGAVTLEAGSVISSAAAAGTAGAVTVLGGGAVRVDGFLGAGPTAAVDADPLVGAVLVAGGSPQRGGAITVLSASTAGPGLQVGSTGVVVSQGEDEGAGPVRLEACGIEVLGLVASIAKGDQAAGVEVRSGEGAVVDGRDLGLPLVDPGFAGRLGALRVGGSLGGGLGQRVELFARGDVEVLGPAPGSTSHFAVSAAPATKSHSSGGTVTVLSTEGSLVAAGNAFLAGRPVSGNRGGSIDLEAAGSVVLDGAVVSAVGNFGGGAPGTGGAIFVQSFQGDLSWAAGTGDVRPTGSGVPVSARGSIARVHCGSVDLTGSSFPTIGAAVPPFPEVFQSCAQQGPTLPPGASLPVCNQPPVAADDDFTTDEDSAVAGDVLADNGHGADFDPGGDPLTVTEVNGVAADVGNLVVLPSGALLTLNADGTSTYDPNGQFEELAPGEEDVDAFEYTIEEPGGLSDSATVTITITGVDDPPVAVDDTATVEEDSGANAIEVLANDTDVDGGPIEIESVTQPTNGTVLITGGGSGLTYEPDADYCNSLPMGSPTDDFTYTLNGGSSATVAVTVTCVDDPPVAVADSATVNEDSGANAIDVLANDTDVDGGPKEVQSVTQPANGAVVITGGGTGVSYTPDADYCNDGSPTDDFTYTLNGGSSATVSATVTCVDDPPVAVADSATVFEDSGANAIDVLANDTDVDGGPALVQSVTQPANGAVVITGGGTGVSYTPSADYCNSLPMGSPTDDFTYTLNGGSSTTVTVTVVCINDPPVAADDVFDFVGNTELRVDLAAATTPHALETTGSGSGLLDNDADPVENDSISVVAVVGCADLTPPFDCVIPGTGTVSLEADGRFSFVPAPGDTDAGEAFQYTLSDGADTATATVTLNRTGRVWYVNNDTPTGGVAGTSADPFDTLAEAQAASVADDSIFVHFGDGTTAGQDAGISLQSGQRLLGEHAGLSIPVGLNGNGSPTVLFAAVPGNRPAVGDTVAGN